MKPLQRRFRKYNNTYALIEKEMPDIIFVHGCQFCDIKQVVRFVKRNPNARVYVDNHADFLNSATNWLSKNILHKVIWRHCAHLIEPFTTKFYGVLPARVEFLKNIYKLPEEKVELLVMGVDDEKMVEAKDKEMIKIIREKHQVKDKDFLIMTGGKIDHNKSQVLLLMEAVQDINRDNVKLIVFGSVNEEIKNALNSLCDGIRVKYIGWIQAIDSYKYFSAADLVVFPGKHSVFWEQVTGLGKPCVFRYMKGFNHVDLGGNCKFLYEDSVNEIKKTLLEIIDNRIVYDHMCSIAQKRGVNTFSYKTIAQKSIENY
jgi:glycosyltransferase involved in cell wall biosynthesis